MYCWTLRRGLFHCFRLTLRLAPHLERAGTPQLLPSQSLGSPHDPRIAAAGGDRQRTLASLSSQTFRRFPPACPGDAADPFDPLDDSFLFVAEGLVDGEREIRNGLTRKCGPHLRIVPGIPEENYLVHSDV